jgi:Protein of unknown function (DUF3592)
MPHDIIWWVAVARDVVAFAIAAGTGILLWLRKRSSRHWPITFGKVESASTYQDNFKWLTDVSYSYSVERDFYSGQFQLRSRSERKANDHELHWKGRTITVRYSPRDPHVSVVIAGDQDGLRGGSVSMTRRV